MIQIDRKIDPIAGRSDFEFAITLDVRPIVTKKKLHDVAVPKF